METKIFHILHERDCNKDADQIELFNKLSSGIKTYVKSNIQPILDQAPGLNWKKIESEDFLFQVLGEACVKKEFSEKGFKYDRYNYLIEDHLQIINQILLKSLNYLRNILVNLIFIMLALAKAS